MLHSRWTCRVVLTKLITGGRLFTEIDEREITKLINYYDKWRRIYGYSGESAPNEPDREYNRVIFRNGYPYPDWTAFILEATAEGRYSVLHASTERRNTPIHSLRAVFSRIEDAGKYIIYEIADSLRVSLQLEPVEQKWRAAGLDALIDKVLVSDKQARYELREDPGVYFLAYSGGIQPYHHLLRLSYDQLDTALLEGFPERVTSQVTAAGN